MRKITWDFKQNNRTGDWLFSANGDFEGTTSDALVSQRMRNRLVVPAGSVIEFPTLGSRLRELVRSPSAVALTEIEVIVHEALEPMADVQINEVRAEVSNAASQRIDVTIYYQISSVDEAVDVSEAEQLTQAFSVDELLQPVGEEAA